MKNPHKQFPGKMDKTTKRTYKLSFKMGYGKLKHVKMFESFDAINENFSDEEMEKIKEVIKKGPMTSLKKPLEDLGFIVQVNTYDMPMPPMIIEVRKNKNDKKRVVIVNRKYTDDADFVHGETAMGIMESAIVNEAQSAPAVGAKNQRISKDFKNKVDDMIALAQKFEKLSEEYTAMSKLLGKYEADVQTQLEKYGAQFIRIGSVAIELKKIAGRETKAYKAIADALEGMLEVSPEMEAAIKNVYDMNTKINPDKVKMLYAVEENAVTDFVKKLGAWFTNLWDKIKAHIPTFTSKVDTLAAELKPLGIKVPTTEEAIKMMKK